MRLCDNCAIFDICDVSVHIKKFGATHCSDYCPILQISIFDDFDLESSLFGDKLVKVKEDVVSSLFVLETESRHCEVQDE